MHDPATVLDWVVTRDDKLGPVVLYPLERSVLAILSLTAVHDGHRHLHVDVLHLRRPHDEVTLELADTLAKPLAVPMAQTRTKPLPAPYPGRTSLS